jgi:predicted nuclease with TOPRIM domain
MTPEEIKERFQELIRKRNDLMDLFHGAQFGYEYPWRPESLKRIEKNNPVNYERLMKYRDLKSKIGTLRDDYLAQTGKELK